MLPLLIRLTGRRLLTPHRGRRCHPARPSTARIAAGRPRGAAPLRVSRLRPHRPTPGSIARSRTARPVGHLELAVRKRPEALRIEARGDGKGLVHDPQHANPLKGQRGQVLRVGGHAPHGVHAAADDSPPIGLVGNRRGRSRPGAWDSTTHRRRTRIPNCHTRRTRGRCRGANSRRPLAHASATRRGTPCTTRRLGHSSIELTVDLYGKWLPMANAAAVDRLDDTAAGPSGSKKWQQTEPNRPAAGHRRQRFHGLLVPVSRRRAS